MNRYTLLYIKWILNKDLQYSTGSSAQNLVIIYKEKESEKRIYIYILSYYAVRLKLTRCFKSTILQ